MYGKVQDVPQNEKTNFYPLSPYGVAKLYAHWITKNYREAYNIFGSNGILFNHESPRRGETFVTRKITRALSRIKLGLQKTLYIGTLNSKRDWGHARDYVEVQWLMLQQAKPEDFVIATGKQHSVRDFVNLAAKNLNMKIEWKGKDEKEVGIYDNQEIIKIDTTYYRPTEVDSLLGDPSKAKKKLGWQPKISFEQLVQKPTDKGEYYFAEIEKKGKRIETIIPGIIHDLVSEFPWPKSQRWGTSKVNWVRPLHYINVVLDGKILQGSMDLGGDMIIDFTNMGFGHSFYHKDSFEISGFDAYVSRMRELDVLVDVEERRSVILDKANKIAEHKGLRLRSDEILLEEVCGLAEYPNVLCGEIDSKFMSLPDEVLATSMRVHQKYFVLEETNGKIAHSYGAVSYTHLTLPTSDLV